MSDSDKTFHAADRLIARGSYPRAIQLLEREIGRGHDSVRLLQQLADLYLRTGAHRKAIALLLPLVDRLAENGFVAKAIAVLKKVERLEPGQREVEERLARLIQRRQREIHGDLTGRGWRSESTLEADGVAGPVVHPESIHRQAVDARESEYAEEVAPIVHSPLFAGFSTRELVALIRGLGLSTFEAGEIVVTEGEPGNSLFVLASGAVRVYVRDDAGRNHLIRMLKPPQFFGEVCLFDRSPRTATVVAAIGCELLRLDGVTLATIGTKHPDLPRALHRAYTQRVGSLEERRARGESELPL